MAFLTPTPLHPNPRPTRISPLSPQIPTMIRAPPQRPRTAAPPLAPPVLPTNPPAPLVVPTTIPDTAPPCDSQTASTATTTETDAATDVNAPSPVSVAVGFPTNPPPRSVLGRPRVGTKSNNPHVVSPLNAAVESFPAVRDREYYYRDFRKDSGKRSSVAARKTKKKKKNASLTGADDGSAKKGRPGGSEDSVRRYLQEIGEVKLLDAETEISLAKDIAKLVHIENVSAHFRTLNGAEPSVPKWAEAAGMDVPTFREVLRKGLRAKEHMVAANLRLVVSIAKKYMNRGLTFQDLIQEGSIGLIRGAEKFDANKGFKFSTYATWWIRQSITRAIADHSRPIRLPVHVNDTIALLRKTTKLLSSELNRAPNEKEIADRMQIPIEKLRFLTRTSRATLSLETPVGRDGHDSAATLGTFIMWDGDTPEEKTMKNLMREDLDNVLNTLSPRERDVVRMRYGLDDGRMKTLEEIGSIFEVTRERIRQIEAKALRKLRHPNRNAVLREYVYDHC
eukprot:GFKZ01013351.1.p1 GENE.GFKZ01013351.1~~GFKZ01013351.1.p1  ORF type:complete len:507 (-),score=94.05 GFKZ01013351.1:1051-2571(-)